MASMNTAYDFDRAENTYAPVQPRVPQPPELRVVEGRASRSAALMRRGMVVFAFVLVLFSAILYNRMMLTELTAQVEDARREYESLIGESRRTQVELESKTSLRSIQESAEALGMAKAEPYQIEYIDLGEGEQVTLTQEEPTWLESAAQKVHDWFDGAVEYFSSLRT